MKRAMHLLGFAAFATLSSHVQGMQALQIPKGKLMRKAIKEAKQGMKPGLQHPDHGKKQEVVSVKPGPTEAHPLEAALGLKSASSTDTSPSHAVAQEATLGLKSAANTDVLTSHVVVDSAAKMKAKSSTCVDSLAAAWKSEDHGIIGCAELLSKKAGDGREMQQPKYSFKKQCEQVHVRKACRQSCGCCAADAFHRQKGSCKDTAKYLAEVAPVLFPAQAVV